MRLHVVHLLRVCAIRIWLNGALNYPSSLPIFGAIALNVERSTAHPFDTSIEGLRTLTYVRKRHAVDIYRLAF